MRKILLVLLCMGFVAAFADISEAASRTESIEITTYYPAPYGVYHDLRTRNLKVDAQNRVDETDPLICDEYSDLGKVYFFDGVENDGLTVHAEQQAGLRVCTRVENSGGWHYEWAYLGEAGTDLSIIQNSLKPAELILNPSVPDYDDAVTQTFNLTKNFRIAKSRVIGMTDPCAGDLDMTDPTAPICTETEFAFKNKKFGIGTDTPFAPLDIFVNLPASTLSPHNRAIHINNESLVMSFRLRLPAGRNNFKEALDITVPENYKCHVAGSTTRYKQASVTDTDEFLWTHRDLSDGEWYLHYRRTDADVAAATYRPLVDVVCFHTGIVTPNYKEWSTTTASWVTPTGSGSALNDYTPVE